MPSVSKPTCFVKRLPITGWLMTHRVAADDLSALNVQGGVGKVAAGLRRGSGQDAALGQNQEQDGEGKSGGVS